MENILTDSSTTDSQQNPIVFLDIAIDNEKIGRIIIELFKHITPRTAENFRALCTGEKGIGINGKKLCYKGSVFHKIVPQFMIQGGDIINFDGTGGESIYGAHFEDENFKVQHSEKGLLSTVNEGKPHTNNSQFIITTETSGHLNNTNVVFGKILRGMGIVQEISEGPIVKDKPLQISKIIDCGEIKGENWGIEENDGTVDVFPPFPEDWDYASKIDASNIDYNYVHDVINKIKTSGNHYYGKKNYTTAERKYKKALGYYNWLTKNNIPEELKLILSSIRISIMLNQSATKLKLLKYREALDLCNFVLSEDKTNTKALFRRSQAYIGLNDYETGLADLKQLQCIDPDNPEISREIDKVNKSITSYLNHEKQTFKRMFR
ncbi:Similar to Ppid: Peptidyl-prolyl cis-trans isomerase D (Mus musculus) [Cotesia congregata]|uniref:peptidylprolyl isomerase n=1 Tax=Cotesia congregata TaxID=51543 RepID=A0A8J2HPY9_COTCN|nr:Similar to Ppid: Peptidyl-prolyl cis-trans isomerase D (Mus musculus) [Cotesia congregata]